MIADEVFINRCLELALKGLGKTRQNPMVGAVIVNNGKIIGEGYHARFGAPHAESIAINSVKDKSLLRESTLYVNLEPCSHYGKTPPCSFLIRDSKIPKVVIGSVDPNPKVSSKGIRILKDSGIEVITGVRERECRFLNRRFFTFHERKRPYVILKWAQSKDRFIDKKRLPDDLGYTNWISSPTSRILVHKWRSEEIGIMAGTNTILTDDPDLNVRYWPGESPVRIIPDRNMRLFDELKIFKGKSKTLIFSPTYKPNRHNIEFITINKSRYKPSVFLDELYRRNVLSVLVEGGASFLDCFIKSGLWDEARIFTGNVKFIDGIKAPVINAEIFQSLAICEDNLDIYMNNQK